jgi:hypothetical protein
LYRKVTKTAYKHENIAEVILTKNCRFPVPNFVNLLSKVLHNGEYELKRKFLEDP